MAYDNRRGSKVPNDKKALNEQLNEQLSKASAMIGLYEKRANSAVGSQAELEQVQREMKLIKDEILSALLRSKKVLQGLEQEVEGEA